MAIIEDFRAIADRLRELEGGAACDCGYEAGHAHNCAIFRCSVCRTLCDSSPAKGPTFCPTHCPDHDYVYEPGEGKRCRTCGAPPPDDWYDD